MSNVNILRASVVGNIGGKKMQGTIATNVCNLNAAQLGRRCIRKHADEGLAAAHSTQNSAIAPRQVAGTLRRAVVLVDLLSHVHILWRNMIPDKELGVLSNARAAHRAHLIRRRMESPAASSTRMALVNGSEAAVTIWLVFKA